MNYVTGDVNPVTHAEIMVDRLKTEKGSRPFNYKVSNWENTPGLVESIVSEIQILIAEENLPYVAEYKKDESYILIKKVEE